MSEEWKLLTLRLPKEDHKKLKKVAFEEEVSINSIVLKLVQDYLKTK